MKAQFKIYESQAVLKPKVLINNIEIVEKIKEIINENSGVHFSFYSQKSRVRELLNVRQLFHYLCRNYTSLSLKSIGNLTDGRDHTTVLNSIKIIEDILDISKKLGITNNFTQVILKSIEDMNLVTKKIK